MDIGKNYFSVFALREGFDVDQALLAERYLELQREVHPDRYAGAGDREQRLAVQFATYVNEAFTTLKTPLLRAEYLLSLRGAETDHQTQTTSDSVFLMQQMELREELESVREKSEDDAEAALDTLTKHVEQAQSELCQEFAQCYAAEQYLTAQAVVAKLHFFSKLAHEVEQLEAKLLDY